MSDQVDKIRRELHIFKAYLEGRIGCLTQYSKAHPAEQEAVSASLTELLDIREKILPRLLKSTEQKNVQGG